MHKPFRDQFARLEVGLVPLHAAPSPSCPLTSHTLTQATTAEAERNRQADAHQVHKLSPRVLGLRGT